LNCQILESPVPLFIFSDAEICHNMVLRNKLQVVGVSGDSDKPPHGSTLALAQVGCIEISMPQRHQAKPNYEKLN